MLNKEEILKIYNINDRIFASSIIDKINKYEKCDTLIYTNFLDLNEFKIATSLLNKFKINFEVFDLNETLKRKCIAILPSYLNTSKFEYVRCIRITNKEYKKIMHKDYMGTLYNFGIKEDRIGDIYVSENSAIVFVTSDVLDYLLLNLEKVGSNKVILEEIDKDSLNLSHNFEEENFLVSSNRIDAVLAKIYNLSRSNVESKISKGDLVINSINVKSNIYNLKTHDIVSFKRCGKFKFISSSITRKEKVQIKIQKYK